MWQRVLLIALVASTGTTLADDEVDTTSGCAITAGNGTEISRHIFDLVLACLSRNSFYEIDDNWTAEAQEDFLKNYCGKTPQIHECIASVAENSETCLDETNHKIFEILRELLETTLDTLCLENGERFLNIYIPYTSSSKHNFEKDDTRDCVETGTFKVNILVAADIDASIKLYMLYQEAQATKQCVSMHTEGDLLFKNAVNSFLTELLANVKCVHPEEKTTVPCSSIDAHSIVKPNLCPIDSQDVDIKNNILIDRLGRCFKRNSASFDDMGDMKDRTEFRSFFEIYCRQSRITTECLSGTTVYSSLCQNEAQHKTFELLAEAMRDTLEHGCLANGKHVADVMHHVLSEENSTSTSNVITRCFDLAKSTHMTSDLPDGFDNSLRFYRQTKVFRKCVLGNLHGDNEVIFNTELLLNGNMWNMKCHNPELGTVVLCNLIEDPLTITDTTCPYQIDDDAITNTFEMFVQMGSQCILMSSIPFNAMKNYTTIDEFQRFAKSYCLHKPLLMHCLADVKSNSEICQTRENHKGLLILAEMVETGLETGCLDGGNHLKEIFYNQVTKSTPLTLTGSDDFTQCIRDKTHNFRAFSSPSTTGLQLFKEVQGVKGCYVDHSNEEISFKDSHIAYLNEILSKVHCTDPDNGNKVLCKDIPNN